MSDLSANGDYIDTDEVTVQSTAPQIHGYFADYMATWMKPLRGGARNRDGPVSLCARPGLFRVVPSANCTDPAPGCRRQIAVAARVILTRRYLCFLGSFVSSVQGGAPAPEIMATVKRSSAHGTLIAVTNVADRIEARRPRFPISVFSRCFVYFALQRQPESTQADSLFYLLHGAVCSSMGILPTAWTDPSSLRKPPPRAPQARCNEGVTHSSWTNIGNGGQCSRP
jgi:hypothetical protein